MERFFCAASASARGEPQFATASRIDRWLCVEQPGAWGASSLPESGLDPEVLAGLRARATAASARLLLIRRYGGASSSRRHVIVADSRPGQECCLTTTVADDADLAALPLPFDGPAPKRWTPAPGPVVLVCTHGRHDPCCAVRGRPVAAAFAALDPESTWECSHVGGDRFAANVVVLPAGLYLGRVDPAECASVLARLRQGRVPRAVFRGRSAYHPVVQAAQQLAVTELGVAADGIGDLRPRRVDRLGPEQWRVTLRAHPTDVVVDVERGTAPTTEPLTCHADLPRPAPVYRLLGTGAPATCITSS